MSLFPFITDNDDNDDSLLVSPRMGASATENLELLDSSLSPIPHQNSNFATAQVSTPLLGERDYPITPYALTGEKGGKEIILGSTANTADENRDFESFEAGGRMASPLPRATEMKSPVLSDEDTSHKLRSPRGGKTMQHTTGNLCKIEKGALACTRESIQNEEATLDLKDNYADVGKKQKSIEKALDATKNEQNNVNLMIDVAASELISEEDHPTTPTALATEPTQVEDQPVRDEAVAETSENSDGLGILSPMLSAIKGGSNTRRDLTSAKKKLNATSVAIAERIRGTAQQRTLRIVRSIAAKEKQHLLSIPSSKRQTLSPHLTYEETRSSNDTPEQPTVSTTPNPYKGFKALPLPETTGPMGCGGQFGVPKVPKKQTTTPFSPLLGNRRKDIRRIKALEPPKWKTHTARTNKKISAKERHASNRKIAAESTLEEQTHGTIHLGPPTRLLSGKEASRSKEHTLRERIRREEFEAKKKREFHARPLPNFNAVSSPSVSTTSSPLLGLNLLNTTTNDAKNHSLEDDTENRPPMKSRVSRTQRKKVQHSGVSAYQPYSSIRAENRAEFDAQRVQKEKERNAKRKKLVQIRVQQKQEELNELRDSLR